MFGDGHDMQHKEDFSRKRKWDDHQPGALKNPANEREHRN
jgi:hypothetical protein